MKVVYPKNNVIKTKKVPNGLLFNRFLFWILKLFLITNNYLFLKIKYKHIKPIIKKAKLYKNFEIVTINSRQGETVRIFL
ncbi:MAG: hypothetical protein IKV25_00325 [Clostridia bacterium]|nr:hypothetical protein [Clostridia bacterium]